MRPACGSFTRRPGESDAALRCHHRPACVEAAAQPRDGCAAGMGKESGRRAHSEQGVRGPKRRGALPWMSRLTNRHRGSGARPLDRLTQREGAYPPWNAVGRAGLDPSGRSGSGMDPPGFSAGNAGKSQKLRQLSPGQPAGWKAPDGAIGPLRSNRLLRPDKCDGTCTAPSSAICRRSAPGAATSAAAPGSAPPEPD